MPNSMLGQSSYNPASTATGLKGSGYNIGSYQRFTPQQMQLFQQLFSQVSPDSQLYKLAGGDQSQFAQLEAPAHRQFSEALGGIASKFSGMGGIGGRKSSGFQNYTTSAASDFAEKLQSQRMGLQRQALMDLMGISESLLGQNPYETYFFPEKQKKKSFWEQLLGGVSEGVGQGIGSLPFIF